MKITEEIKVGTLNVACDGGKGHLGHPTVYLNLEDKGEVVCPYCSKKYIFDKSLESFALLLIAYKPSTDIPSICLFVAYALRSVGSWSSL